MPRNVDDNAPASRAPFKDLQSSVINKDNIQKPFFCCKQRNALFQRWCGVFWQGNREGGGGRGVSSFPDTHSDYTVKSNSIDVSPPSPQSLDAQINTFHFRVSMTTTALMCVSVCVCASVGKCEHLCVCCLWLFCLTNYRRSPSFCSSSAWCTQRKNISFLWMNSRAFCLLLFLLLCVYCWKVCQYAKLNLNKSPHSRFLLNVTCAPQFYTQPPQHICSLTLTALPAATYALKWLVSLA